MTSDFKALAIQSGLKHLLTQGHFSICQFDELAKAANLIVSSQQRTELAVLHCVNYRDMPPELHRQLVERVTSLFGFALPAVEAKVAPEKQPNLFLRFLKGGS